MEAHLNSVVHILVSCRNPELFRSSTLVFDTIRTGFPTAEIFATGNNLSDDHAWEIMALCDLKGVQFVNRQDTGHHPEWIESLIQNEPRNFFIVDTDCIFWDSLEQFEFKGPLHGRYTPRFRCPFTSTITNDRLHTCVLYIEPEKVKAGLAAVNKRLNENENPFFRRLTGIQPLNYAVNGEVYFHDSMGQAYHAIGGNKFGNDVLECFDHIGAGTYLDLLDKKVPGARARQEVYLNDPKKARGLYRLQQLWEKAHAA